MIASGEARGRPGPAPRPWVADIFAGLAGLGFGAILALVISGETPDRSTHPEGGSSPEVAWRDLPGRT